MGTCLLFFVTIPSLKENCNQILKIENGQISQPFDKDHFNKLEDEMKEKVLLKDVDKLIL